MKYSQKNIFIARTFPYFPEKIENIIAKYSNNKNFNSSIIGYSTLGYPIYLFKISNNTHNNKKKDIWVHSRTHPAETQSSFVLEGMIQYILENQANNSILDHLNFYIVPIVNIDGIVVGNSRLTPGGIDIERQWIKDIDNKNILKDSVSQEVKVISRCIDSLIKNKSEFILALNLHGKNEVKTEKNFIYTNFKKPLESHGIEGDIMYYKQLNFVRFVSNAMEKDTLFVKLGYNPGTDMSNKLFPESWWWANFKSKVMAATLEVTESSIPVSERKSNIDDYYIFGKAIVEGINNYYFYYDHDPNNSELTIFDLYEIEKYYKQSPWEK